jgi:hypothetical protein
MRGSGHVKRKSSNALGRKSGGGGRGGEVRRKEESGGIDGKCVLVSPAGEVRVVPEKNEANPVKTDISLYLETFSVRLTLISQGGIANVDVDGGE